MSDHPFGWTSLLPPIVAIVLAIATRRVILSLLLGVLLGSFILAGRNLWLAIPDALESQLWASLIDEDHLRVFAFTLLMGAMVGVIHRSGGMHGIVERIAPLARSSRGGQLVTWALGLIIFFDDYANTLLLGGTMKPLADRLKISREKLAYLVDSTAAPVAGLAIISTWVAGEIGYIESGFTKLELTEQVNAFDIFVQTIPYRFYVLLALIFVPMVAYLGRDFGPMLSAERAARDPPRDKSGKPNNRDANSSETTPDVPHLWHNAAVPILILISVTIWLLGVTGWQTVRNDPALESTLFNIFSRGNSYIALVYGSLSGLITAAWLAWQQGILKVDQLRTAAFDGARHVLPALAILWLAWSLSQVTDGDHLKTGDYLGEMVKQAVTVNWMPTIVFVLASFVAFATGTSWGTMGILMPLVIEVTYRMLAADGGAVNPSDTLMVATIGSVLAGAIFGDHCSPISDTTVLSSHASGCNHIAHVWTQMPYALTVGGVSILCGTLPIGFGVPVWVLLPLSVIALLAVLLVFGKRIDEV